MAKKSGKKGKTRMTIPKLEVGRFGSRGGKTLKVVYGSGKGKIGTLWIGKSKIKWIKARVREKNAIVVKKKELNALFSMWEEKKAQERTR